jgi:hypothetical protein
LSDFSDDPSDDYYENHFLPFGVLQLLFSEQRSSAIVVALALSPSSRQ